VTGTWTFVRAFLRRDRWMLLWWSVGVAVLYWSQAWSVDGLYTSQADFDRAAASMAGNAGFIAMTGPARALNTIGGQVTWQSAAFGAIAAGLMSMFLVGRHTRAEEESGRDEMLRAAAVGRHSTTVATYVTAMIANLLLGSLVALSLITYPLGFADSLALGVGVALCGAFYSGVALVAAQLTSTTRAMYGITGGVLGLSYALRAVGDVGNPALSWMSPIGWYQAMHPFSGLRWWPALLLVAGSVIAAAAAYAVFLHRDYGSGVLAARPGSARAAGSLHRAPGLPWRLQRGAVFGWTAGMLLGGVGYGTLGDDVEDLMGDSNLIEDMFAQGGGALVDAFYATMILTLALIGSGFAISSALRPRSEEEAGRVEALLATGLRRHAWLLGHVLVTLAGTVLVLLAAGLGMGIGYALVTGKEGAVGDYVLPVLGHLPAVLVLAATAQLLYGLSARLASLAWVGLLFAFVVMMFGELFRFPQWLQDVSPFEHLALVPAQDFRWAPFLALTAVAASLSVAGQLAFLRRDVH